LGRSGCGSLRQSKWREWREEEGKEDKKNSFEHHGQLLFQREM
jgi:hypothetical protein